MIQFDKQQERAAMAKSFKKMSENASYLKKLGAMEEEFDDVLPNDKEAWWTSKK